MRKKYNELTEDELRSLFADLETGVIDAGELTEEATIEADPETAFDTMVEVERERASGLDQRVVFVGRGRDFLGLSEVVREMVAGTLDEDKHPYFTKSPVSGVWQHDGNKTKVTISIPAFERETRE